MITDESAEGKQKNAYDQVHLTCYITNTLTIDEIKQKTHPSSKKCRKNTNKLLELPWQNQLLNRPQASFPNLLDNFLTCKFGV
jgi:hypothetical protein